MNDDYYILVLSFAFSELLITYCDNEEHQNLIVKSTLGNVVYHLSQNKDEKINQEIVKDVKDIIDTYSKRFNTQNN